MITVYRRQKNVDSEWHFHTQCPHWPETNFDQVRFVEPERGERICEECVKLEREMYLPGHTADSFSSWSKSRSNFTMQLRDHPGMRYGGLPNWPPTRWTTTRKDEKDFPVGEVGILHRALKVDFIDNVIYLQIDYLGKIYTGCLPFDDVNFCRYIYKVLQGLIHRPIKEIGDLEMSHTL